MRDDERIPPPRGATIVALDDDLAWLVIPDPEPAIPDALTEAEAEVARLIFDGLSNARIAEVRDTSARTVDKQVSSIFRKLGVASRSELVLALLPVDTDAP